MDFWMNTLDSEPMKLQEFVMKSKKLPIAKIMIPKKT